MCLPFNLVLAALCAWLLLANGLREGEKRELHACHRQDTLAYSKNPCCFSVMLPLLLAFWVHLQSGWNSHVVPCKTTEVEGSSGPRHLRASLWTRRSVDRALLIIYITDEQFIAD